MPDGNTLFLGLGLKWTEMPAEGSEISVEEIWAADKAMRDAGNSACLALVSYNAFTQEDGCVLDVYAAPSFAQHQGYIHAQPGGYRTTVHEEYTGRHSRPKTPERHDSISAALGIFIKGDRSRRQEILVNRTALANLALVQAKEAEEPQLVVQAPSFQPKFFVPETIAV
jgi:hypothetical protein